MIPEGEVWTCADGEYVFVKGRGHYALLRVLPLDGDSDGCTDGNCAFETRKAARARRAQLITKLPEMYVMLKRLAYGPHDVFNVDACREAARKLIDSLGGL